MIRNEVVPFNRSNKKDWRFHANRIAAAWQKTVSSIIETGQYLIEAKAELERDSFDAMAHQKLPFTASVASRLMAIAGNSELTKVSHVKLLPPSWGTLYQLSKLPEQTLREKIADHTIHPKMERKEALILLPKHPNGNPKGGPKPKKDQYYREVMLKCTDSDEEVTGKIFEVLGPVRCIAVCKLLKKAFADATIGIVKIKP